MSNQVARPNMMYVASLLRDGDNKGDARERAIKHKDAIDFVCNYYDNKISLLLLRRDESEFIKKDILNELLQIKAMIENK